MTFALRSTVFTFGLGKCLGSGPNSYLSRIVVIGSVPLLQQLRQHTHFAVTTSTAQVGLPPKYEEAEKMTTLGAGLRISRLDQLSQRL
jgi:hypothetical protein